MVIRPTTGPWRFRLPDRRGGRHVSGRRRIVVFRTDCVPDEGCVRRLGGQPLRRINLVNAYVANFETEADVQTVAAMPEVLRVDEDLRIHIVRPWLPPLLRWGGRRAHQLVHRFCPRRTDAGERIPWGVEYIASPQAWTVTRGGGVKVAVIDTGVDLGHPDLAGLVAGGYNAISQGRDPQDDNGHGTHVVGTVGAPENGIGVIGVAPEISLYAVKALDAWGSGYLSDLVEALDWCVREGIQVANLSLGTRSDNETFRQAVRRAHDAGLVLVAAAGNEGGEGDTVNYPARYEETIAVSAIDGNGRLAKFASQGPAVDLVAPGVDVESAWPGGSHRSLSGTSMAAPHVAGVAALILASRGSLAPTEVRARLLATARRLPGLKYGLVDAYRSVY